MKLKNGDIIIDDDFPCSSAGDMRIIESSISEIGYKPEEIPQWFQDLLDELFDGAGVPKEYMAHVRVRHLGNRAKWATLRFLLSKKGANYMYPPWWIWRENTGWAWIPSENTDFHPAEHIDISIHIQPGETIRIASALMKTHPSSAKKRNNYPNNTTSGPTGKSVTLPRDDQSAYWKPNRAT